MKKNKILLILGSVLFTVAMLWSACTFPLQCGKVIAKEGEQAKLVAASPMQHDALLNGVPVSVPAPALMQLRKNSLKSSFWSKLFVLSLSDISVFVKNFSSLYKNERVSNALYPMRLHVAFCVFRI